MNALGMWLQTQLRDGFNGETMLIREHLKASSPEQRSFSLMLSVDSWWVWIEEENCPSPTLMQW